MKNLVLFLVVATLWGMVLGCSTSPNSEAMAAAPVRDPAKTDPDKYHVVFENEYVRVLEYKDKPGDKTTQHSHPDSVLTALSSFKRRLSFPDGKSVVREVKPGEVAWIPAQTHVGENIGDTETHVILVEVKHPSAK